MSELEDIFNAKLQEAHKLTDWKNEPTVDKLLHDYTQAVPFHSEQVQQIDKWLKLTNPQPIRDNITKGRSGVAPKVIRRLIEWRNASLTTTFLNERNLFQVNPTSPKYIDSAIQNELILNYQFNTQIPKVSFINSLIRTLTTEGTAVVRVGWDEQVQTKEKMIPIYQYVQADEMQAQQLMQFFQQVDEEMQQGVTDPKETQAYSQLDPVMKESIKATQEYGFPVMAVDTGQKQIIKEEVQIRNRPSLETVNVSDIIIDPTCNDDLSKANFAIYRYETNLSALKSAGIYKNLDKLFSGKDGLTAEAISTMSDEVFSRLETENKPPIHFQDNPRKTLIALEYWGYWDIDGTGITQGFVATIVNGIIIRMERNPFPDNQIPFVIIPYIPVKKSLYGQPDAELIEDNQAIITATMRSIIDINARSANGQIAISKGFLDPINLDKFQKGENYEYNPTGVHPSDAIFMHTANEIPQSALLLIQNQFAEAEATTGIKAFQNGIDGNAYGQVVAGMSQAITAMTQRESDIIFRISEGLSQIGNKIIAMNSLWLNDKEVVAISNKEFIDIYRDDLKGDFHLSVSVKSNSESEGKAQQLTFIAQTLGQDADWGLRKMILLEICRLYGLDNMVMNLQEYEPQPDPLAEKQRELQVAEIEAKIEKIRQEALYYRERAEYISAETQNVQSDTDLKDLNFIEQQEGVKHERQKEIVQAQAEAQNKGKLMAEQIKAKAQQESARIKNGQKPKGDGKLITPDGRVNTGLNVPDGSHIGNVR